MTRKRKIIAITGTRAEYGLATSIFRAIENHPKLELGLIVTGMHLSHEFGYTIREIKKDKFKIVAKINNLAKTDKGRMMVQVVGQCLLGLVGVLEKIKPDILFILTDLGHTLAGAIAGAYMNIPVAHLHGGDVSGSVDDSVRHAITKLSHIHFPATKNSAERIIKMGEEPWRIYIVGAPGLDVILNSELIPHQKVAKKYELNFLQPVLLAIQHSVTTEAEDASNQMKETMEAIKELGYQTILIYPNADAGGRRMIRVIQKYRKYPFIRIYKNIPRQDYLSLMKRADVMVGNSSSGIIEAPSFKLPVVNIGTRQQGRERAGNVIDVGYNKNQIKRAIKKSLFDQKFQAKLRKITNPYGDGKTGPRIAKILSKIKINEKLLQKRLTY